MSTLKINRKIIAPISVALVLGFIDRDQNVLAAGTERVSVAVFAVPKDASGNRNAAAIGALLRQHIKSRPLLKLIEPGRILAGDQRFGPESLLDRAREALADGQRLYDGMSLDESIARFGQAISLFEQTGPLLDDLADLKIALAYLGAALTLRGSADEGLSTFAELLVLDPAFSPQGFTPLITKLFERAISQSSQHATGKLEIYTTPPNAAVFVDGVYRGVSPITLDSIAVGKHFLRIEKHGYAPYGGPVEITTEQNLTSQTRLKSITRGDELRDLLARAGSGVAQGGMNGHLRELARLLICDALVVVNVSQSGKDISVHGGVYARESATRIDQVQAVLTAENPSFQREAHAYLERIVRSLTELQAGQDPKTIAENHNTAKGLSGFGLSEGAGRQEQQNDQRTGAYANTGSNSVDDVVVPSTPAIDGAPDGLDILSWGLVGVGGAGVITGIVYASFAKQSHDQFLNTSQNDPELPVIQNEGRSQAMIADIGFGVGGVLTLIGASILTVRALQRPIPTELLGQVRFSANDNGFMVNIGGDWN